jgi:hypothetical protein
MNKQKKTIGALIIASAIIWGAVIVGSSAALRGTECYTEIQNILVGGVVSHLILIWGPLGILFRKRKDGESETTES